MERMSILGLYQYNEDVFSGLVVPDGVDSDTVIAYILNENEGLTLLRPDYDFMQQMIYYWSKAELPSWEKLQQTMTVEYNPVYNYDRYEEWTDSGTSKASNKQEGKGSSVNAQKAFNTDNFKDTVKTDSEDSASSSGTASSDSEHKGHMYGNIGVTTAMQMIKEQREVVDWNIYQFIAESFRRRFCIEVW